MKRSRRGGRRPQHSNGGGGDNGGGGNNSGGGFNPNRTFDSSGPEIKIRGSASHVYEKYLQLARDANSERRPGDGRELSSACGALLPHHGGRSRPSRPSIRRSRRPRIRATASPATSRSRASSPSRSRAAAPSFSLAEGGTDEEEGEDAEAT